MIGCFPYVTETSFAGCQELPWLFLLLTTSGLFFLPIYQEGFRKLPLSYQRSFQIAHYIPWLLYWWMTQTWFPSLSTDEGSMFGDKDLEILKSLSEAPSVGQVVTYPTRFLVCRTTLIFLFIRMTHCF